jgi:alginate O-acetyltransferase complex protein AlgI
MGFLIFGAMHGAMVIVSVFTLSRRDKFWATTGVPDWVIRVLRIIITYCLVTLAFVVFRADSLPQAMQVYQAVFSLGPFHDMVTIFSGLLHHHVDIAAFGSLKGFILCCWTIPCLVAGDILARNKIVFEKVPAIVQVAGYNYGLLLILTEWLTHYGSQPFVYYKF